MGGEGGGAVGGEGGGAVGGESGGAMAGEALVVAGGGVGGTAMGGGAGQPAVQNEDGNHLGNFPLGRTFLLLRFERLNFHIGRAHVLRDLEASAKQGELVALMGESGSGKTSLLKVLSGRAT